jgi:DnaK suppressor protein
MTKRESDKIRNQLLAKLSEVTGGASRREGLIAERSNDPMDQMQSRVDLDLAVTAINTNFETKKAIETALDLLTAGDYGTCQDCGDPINPKRLQALPWTALCIHCREAHDADRRMRADAALAA